jgi:hypothetical protein
MEVFAMQKLVRKNAGETCYSVTLYGATDATYSERYRLSMVFREVLERILGSAQEVIDFQYDYNRIVDKYEGTPLPLTATGDERLLVMRWENAYEAAFGAAFVAVYGALDRAPDEAHFEIQEESDL